MSRPRTRRALLLACLAVPACTLIDQTTFNPDAGKRPALPKPPPAPPPVAAEPGPPALLSIRLPASTDPRPEIAKAVAAARARKRDVAFDVVEITPDTGASVGTEAADVARAIVAQGIPPARVRLAVRPTPNVAREVRVYVH